jgi:hypothetical protein
LVIEFVASPVENWVSAEKSKIVIYSKTAAQFADELGIQVGAGQLISYVTANEFIGKTAVTANDPPILKYSELPARKYLVYEGRTFYSDEKGNTFPQATGITGVLPDGTKTFGGFIESDIAGVNNVASSLNDQVKLVNSNLPNITSNEFLGQYMFTPTETTQYYIGKGFEIVQPEPIPEPEPIPIIISNEAQIILNKFNNGDYIVSEGINSGIELLRDGSLTSEVFVSAFNNLLKNKSIIDRTIEVIPPVIQPIQLSQDNFLPNGNVRVIRMTGIEANDYELIDGVALENLQSLLDSTVVRLLTQAELDFEEKFCVNVYSVNQDGSISSTNYPEITADQRIELEKNQFVVSCDATTLPTQKQIQDFYNYTPPAPIADSSINTTMVSQSVGSFILKDGILKGEILYIANQAQYNNENKLISGFNPFYYSESKNLISFVQINSKSGIPLISKPNGLNFTATERDERIQIDEGHAGELKNYKEITVDFLVLKSPSDMRAFASNKQIQVIEEPPPNEPKPCQIGYHKDFSGKCVPDDPTGAVPRDKLIDTLKGFLFGTVALSLLARKY